ncbi:myb domain-containing protein [Cavenderia fasciculata]|uniref:Myb domain-containing protein n=1 Tax=Cavenderia fasciculata TaxID=261658 RepID=F4Q393_CACFS|nr:myb domain-containing protein [Cavenderia fasciculata]EGG17603.1 myb domain-containing protein [Cavenderia fasciculata]|eukprot:XP_004356087.1 myb domain-containing protein [Cavenderia fasciculata]
MSDIKDILGVTPTKEAPSTGSAVDSILKKKVVKTPNKEPLRGQSIIDRLQSTFRALEGETLSFSSPVTQQAFKEKRKIKVNFEKRGFRNSSRKDNLVLYHWAKSSDKVDENKYAKYNKKMEVLVYTEEEYDLYLRDPNWTKEDTDKLLDQCQKYDTRFIIVHDRYNGLVPRSVEDLKERYYKIQSKLVELRTKAEEDPYHNPLTGYNYNKIYEVERKLQADQLFQLSKEQVQEENDLSEKYFNIERHLLKHSKESKSIMKLAATAISNGPLKSYSQQDLAEKSQTGDSAIKKSKKRKSMEASLQAQDDKISPAGQRQSNRVEATLFDMHIGQPYSNVIAKRVYNDLKQDMMILLDLQRYFIEKRYHLEILKKQKEFLEKEIQDMNLPEEALLLEVEEDEPEQQQVTTEQTTAVAVAANNNVADQTPFQIYGTGAPIDPTASSSSTVPSSTVDLSISSSSVSLAPTTPKQSLSVSVDSTSSSTVATPLASAADQPTKKVSKKKARALAAEAESESTAAAEVEQPATKKKKTPSKSTKKSSAPATEATDNFTINVESMSDDQSAAAATTTTPKPSKRKSKKAEPTPPVTEKKSASKKKSTTTSTSKKKSTPNLNLSPLPPPSFN